MKKIKLYIKAAFYHIRMNKNYSFFSIIGTALTFLFINIILQVVYSQIADIPPNINTERILSLSSLNDDEGKPMLFSNAETNSIISEIKIAESFSLKNILTHNVIIKNERRLLQCCYANNGLWHVRKYGLSCGRFFTKEECENRTPVVLVREGIVKSYFTGPAIGQKINIGKKEFEVIGVIKDYPFQLGPGGIPPALWIPYSLTDKVDWEVDILFSQDVDIKIAKEMVARSLNNSVREKNANILFTADKMSTIKEMKDNKMRTTLVVFSSVVIFLLLLIPAVNMFTLNLASTNNRASEIAIQRAFGATKTSAFIQIVVENAIMTIVGAIIGIYLSYPLVSLVERYLVPPSIEGVSLTIGVNLPVLLFGAFPLILLLSFVSGGFPAYMIAKQNIANTLKGGFK